MPGKSVRIFPKYLTYVAVPASSEEDITLGILNNQTGSDSLQGFLKMAPTPYSTLFHSPYSLTK